jgi:xanthine dehydrogenase small subunit
MNPVPAPVRFLLNGEPVTVEGVATQTMLLEYLRDVRRLIGTKEGCAEGDCGACTVVLAEPDARSARLDWKPVNACIRLLPSVAGKAVFTVESLKSHDGTLHPVQQALVAAHGSQCGFCTPGFAMSLFGLYKNAWRPSRAVIEDALSGNLCRCTGYRPIVAAAQCDVRRRCDPMRPPAGAVPASPRMAAARSRQKRKHWRRRSRRWARLNRLCTKRKDTAGGAAHVR